VVDLSGQIFLNGGFEINTAGFDQINLDNTSFNGYMSNTIAYGSFGNMDIVASNTYCNGPQSGNWFVSLTGGETDAITLELSSPLVAGQTYSISFWDRACIAFSAGSMPIQLGLTNIQGTTGTIFYTAPNSTESLWTERVVTFTAPMDGLYISASLINNPDAANTSTWAHIDNFQFDTPTCPLVLNLGNDQIICTGELLLLDATLPEATYVWQDGSISASFNVLAGGTYTVTATIGSCDYMDSIIITEVAEIDVELGANSNICPGESVTLNATIPGATYFWQDGSTLSTYVANSTEQVSVDVSIGPCSNSDNISVTLLDFPTIDLGENISVCIGTTVLLDAANAGYSYVWQDGNTGQTYSTATSGLYSVEYTNGVCSNSDQVQVIVNPNPIVVVNGPFTICEGDEIELSASALSTYLWTPTNLVSDFNDASPTASVLDDQVFTVQGESAAGCPGSATIIVNVIEMNITGNPPSGIVPHEVQFTNSSEGENFNWSFGDGSTYASQNLNDWPSYTYLSEGFFETILTSSLNGTVCFDTLTINVFPESEITLIPNVITANNRDGNQTFRILSENLKSLDITVYNRWGNEVGKITKPNGSWSANENAAGTYFYILTALGVDGKEYTREGSFTVITE